MSLATAPAATAVPPPPGPGVQPPFIAPPTDGLRTRRRIGIASAIVSVVLLCGGVVAGVNVLIAASNAEYRDQARTVVEQYAGDLNLGHYADAYGLLCVVDRDAVPLAVFQARFEAKPVRQWRVFDAQLVRGTAVVRVDFRYADGSIESHSYPVVLTTDGPRVCP